jgi:hypothetical protein
LRPIDILTGEIAIEVTGVIGVSPALWYFRYIASIFLTLYFHFLLLLNPKSYRKSLFSRSKFPKKFSGNFRSSLDNVFDSFELTSAMTVIDKLIKYHKNDLPYIIGLGLLYLVITSIKICSSIVNFFQNFVQYWYTSNVIQLWKYESTSDCG